MSQALLVLQLVQAVMAAAPQIAEGITRAKGVIDACFTSKVLTQAEQAALMAYVDVLGQLAAAGIPPSHWTVEPNPVA